MTPCIYLKKMPQKCLNHYPTNNSIWDTWYVSTRYLSSLYSTYKKISYEKNANKDGIACNNPITWCNLPTTCQKSFGKGDDKKIFLSFRLAPFEIHFFGCLCLLLALCCCCCLTLTLPWSSKKRKSFAVEKKP